MRATEPGALRLLPALVLALGSACPPAGEATLEVAANPKTIDDRGQTSTLTLTATDAKGQPGQGQVVVRSEAGSLTDAQTVALSPEGTATATFACNAATHIRCSGRVRIAGEWTTGGLTVVGETRVQVGIQDGGTGGGTGGGTSGGTGGGTGGGAGGGTGGGAGGGAGGGGGTGGGAGGGGGSGGGPADSGVRLNPAHVVIWGTLTQYACEGAVAEMDAGHRPLIGVPCAALAAEAKLRTDGGVLYRDPTSQRVYAVVADPPQPAAGGGWQYPTNITANDVEVATGCSGAPGEFFVRPTTGEVVYTCGGGAWLEGASTPVSALVGAEVIALGYSGSALVRRSNVLHVLNAAGTATPVATAAGLQPSPGLTRAHAQGFLTVKVGVSTCELYLIKLDGSTQKLGDYSSPGTGVFCAGRIDDQGVMFYAAVSIGAVQVVRRPLSPDPLEFVFGSDVTPTNWGFGPAYHLRMIDGNGLLTGP